MIKHLMVDVVNPRLSKYPGAWKLAFIILAGQATLIWVAAWYYREFEATVMTVTMSTDEANRKGRWEGSDRLLGSMVVIGGDWRSRWWAVIANAHPDWRYFDHSYTGKFKDKFEKDGHMGFAKAIDWEINTEDLPKAITGQKYDDFFYNDGGYGALSFPCKVDHLRCDDYAQMRNGSRLLHVWTRRQRNAGGKLFEEGTPACDPLLRCDNAEGSVVMTYVHLTPRLQCLTNALSLVGYMELVLTAVVMYVYMACRRGCCWFRDKAMLDEYKAVVQEKPEKPEISDVAPSPSSSASRSVVTLEHV